MSAHEGAGALSPAAERLLQSASLLFCREGIRAVGIDRILAESGVAKATLYQAFGSKESLVVAHLERRDLDDREAYLARIAEAPAGSRRVTASFDLAAERAEADGYLGCVYANALNEFAEPDAPIARAVRAHRAWLQRQWVSALVDDGRTPGEAGRIVAETQIAYDGGLLGSKVERSVSPIRLAAAMVTARLRVAV